MAHVVLLVEDDEDIREALRAVLRVNGFEVECAHDGVDALRMLWRGLRPCVILLDVMLPRLDGYTFRDLQRADARWADIPVIVVSALDKDPDRMDTLSPLAWLKKPFDVDALTAAVARYC